MIKHEEVRESFQTLKNKRIYTDWDDTLYDFNHKALYDFNPKAFDDIEQYIEQQEKKDIFLKKNLELLELKNREINLLNERLNFDKQDELQSLLFTGNDLALRGVRKYIKALEEELK